MSEPETRSALPLHPRAACQAPPGRLRIDGLVERPLDLSPDDLAALPQQALTDDFTCLEGWTVRDLDWRGVRLEALLELAAPQAEARWVQASAEEFSVPIPLDQARRALVATHLGDQPLSGEHGGPARLVVPGGVCFTSVKWLDRLELRADPGPNTAQSTALGRLR